MKVLILALPRTGSTSLMFKISKERNLREVFEPFDGTGRNPYNGEDGVVVKSIVCHRNDNIEWLKEFDEVILLSRRNLKECAESHSYRIHNSSKGFTSLDEYYWEPVPEELFELCYNNVTEWNKELEGISKETGIPITYYEDIWDTKGEGRLRKGNKSEHRKLM